MKFCFNISWRRLIILYLEMIFTLLLTETRDLQRRRKYWHGCQLSITDRRRFNDNWRDEHIHQAIHTIHVTFATSTNTSINRYETSLSNTIVYLKHSHKKKNMSTIDILPESASKSTLNTISRRKMSYTLKTSACFFQAVVVAHLPDIWSN